MIGREDYSLALMEIQRPQLRQGHLSGHRDYGGQSDTVRTTEWPKHTVTMLMMYQLHKGFVGYKRCIHCFHTQEYTNTQLPVNVFHMESV